MLTTTPLRFWRARFARIYPMHLVGLLLTLPFFAQGSLANHVAKVAIAKEGAKQLALSALLVQAWLPAHVLDLNGPSWSLSVEAFFYATFPLLVRLLGRLRARGLVAVAVVAWAAAVTPPLLHHGPASALAPATHLDLVLLHNPLVRLPDFVIGVVSGLLFLRGKREWSRAPVIATATFLLVLAILAESDHLPFLLLHNGLLDPLWALLLFSLAMQKDRRGIGGDALVRGGHASYSLYVLHKPLYFWLARIFDVGLLPPSPFLAAYVGRKCCARGRGVAVRRRDPCGARSGDDEMDSDVRDHDRPHRPRREKLRKRAKPSTRRSSLRLAKGSSWSRCRRWGASERTEARSSGSAKSDRPIGAKGHTTSAAPIHVAFTAPNRAAVVAFHAAALAAGGTDFGAAGPRPLYHPNYYGAFVLDPDGNNVEAVIHTPE